MMAITLLMGAVGGALGGGIASFGSSFLGNFGNSFGYSLLSNSASGTLNNVIFGNDLTVGGVIGMGVGGLVGTALPRYNAVTGGAFKNAVTELGINAGRGAVSGLASGLTIAAIDGRKDAIWQNTLGGTISGTSNTLLTIGVFGPGTRFDDSFIEHGKDRPVIRQGGISSLLFGSGYGLNWGRTAFASKGDAETVIHESHHYLQQKRLGFANFYGRTIKEYAKAFIQTGSWRNVSYMKDTLENEAFEIETNYRNSKIKFW